MALLLRRIDAMALTAHSGGVFPIAPTPFLPAGEIDWLSVDRLYGHYETIGSDGLTVLALDLEPDHQTSAP